MAFCRSNRTENVGLPKRRFGMLALVFLMLVLIHEPGCDFYIVNNPDVSLVQVTLTPEAVTLGPNGQVLLTATSQYSQHDATISWRLESSIGSAAVGQLTINGMTATYTAPAQLSAIPQTVIVDVRSNEDSTRNAQCVITLTNNDSLSRHTAGIVMSPLSVLLQAGASQQFQATLLNSSNTGVTWTIVGGPGSITQSGLFTAPTTLATATATTSIQATSTSDPNVWAQAIILITGDSLICFQRDVLPVFYNSCGMSGCHTPGGNLSDLTSYDGIVHSRGNITPGNAASSKLYARLTTISISTRMPPPPHPALGLNQILLIGNWINQGAQNTSCSSSMGCDTTNIHYSNFVQVITQNYCVSCHQGSTAAGGIDLSTYTGVKQSVQNGSFIDSINGATGFKSMPPAGSVLDSCTISQLQSWINRGAPND